MGKSVRMRNKNAIITGSTQGLGESISRKLVQEGLSGLVICGRNNENGKRLEAEFSSSGCRTVFVQADLAVHADVMKITQAAEETFGEIHVLVNSAGMTDRSTLLDTSPEFFDRMIAVNFRAPFFLMQGAAKMMKQHRTAGRILNILSMSSYGGQPFLSVYSASKGALMTLTKNAAFSLMRDHIRVNGINLGWTDTPGEDRIQHTFHHAGDHWLAEAERGQPFGRLVKPGDVAELASFILSEKSGLLTGAIIDYDQSVHGANYSQPRP
jgi:NAD(P)-dependent dehydrogenase (short-subunit alcohol dehydrogenase family)